VAVCALIWWRFGRYLEDFFLFFVLNEQISSFSVQPRGPWPLLLPLLLLLMLMSMIFCVVPFDDNSNLAFSTRFGRLFVILMMMMMLLLLVSFFFCFSHVEVSNKKIEIVTQ